MSDVETLRDKFAMAALQGCLAYSHYNEQWGDYHNNSTNEALASYVYKIADAMVAHKRATDVARPAREAAE